MNHPQTASPDDGSHYNMGSQLASKEIIKLKKGFKNCEAENHRCNLTTIFPGRPIIHSSQKVRVGITCSFNTCQSVGSRGRGRDYIVSGPGQN